MQNDEVEKMEALGRTREVPMNRKTRRKLAKNAGVRFNVVNHGMIKQPPTYLGIRQFKKAAGDNKKLAAEYKTNAHQSLAELRERAALERAKVTDGKEISVAQMKDLKKS